MIFFALRCVFLAVLQMDDSCQILDILHIKHLWLSLRHKVALRNYIIYSLSVNCQVRGRILHDEGSDFQVCLVLIIPLHSFTIISLLNI